ncbi:MAG TPA: class I SAM-dependent methyltransferase [Acidobacteriota bacterium]|jgi:ubiquinone/menaquinone biosynthesis C-methylase UbiE|nr:class I SAM-dependent methyltransferase [Acidobacteriota bacterium]
MDGKAHWEAIWAEKPSTEMSWYQARPELSLRLIESAGIEPTSRIIDVGGGASMLVDELLARGFRQVTVLDIAPTALQAARERLAAKADAVTWVEADITRAALPSDYYDLWHDRAVFHFLTQTADRQQYIRAARRSVRTGGHVIIATFAADGPTQCSGLNVLRYNVEALDTEFGSDFELQESVREDHHTPLGKEQKFIYCHFKRRR